MIRNLTILFIAVSFAANALCDGTASAQTFRSRHFQVRKHVRYSYPRVARGSKIRFASQPRFTQPLDDYSACPPACCECACKTSCCSSYCIPPFDPLGLLKKLFPIPCCFSSCGREHEACGCGGGGSGDVYEGEASLEEPYPFGKPDNVELITPEPDGKRPAQDKLTVPPAPPLAPPKAPVDDPLKSVSSPVKRDLQITPSLFKP